MTKSNSNMSVSEIIQAIGSLFLMISLFIGLLFFNNGNLLLASFEVVLIIGALYGLAYVLVRFKKVDTDQKRMRLWEGVTLILGYGSVCLLSLYFFIHFMNIEFAVRSEVKVALNQELDDMATQLDTYEAYVGRRVDLYEKKISNAIRFNNYQEVEIDPNRDINSQKQAKISALTSKLLDAFEPLDENVNAYVSSNKKVVSEWSHLKVPGLSYGIAKKKTELYDALVRLSKGTDADEGEPFELEHASVSFEGLSNPAYYFHQTNWVMTLLVFMVFHVMILWPYVFAARSERGMIDGRSGQKTGGTL